jgi:hypothetical protein
MAYCKDKPANLPEFIDREKITSESSLSRGARKNRRQGSIDGDGPDHIVPKPETDGHEEFIVKGRVGHPSNRRENVGWQPSNHQEHAEQFINRHPVSKFQAPRSGDNHARLIPGKGVPRRGAEAQQTGGTRQMEHQPALANVVTRQQQGFANFNSKLQTQGGLDAFSMGDIRQAEKFMEGGQMGLDEYARKVASGEISRATSKQDRSQAGQAGSFFAEEDGTDTARPWLQTTGGNSRVGAVSQGRLVPGFAAQRPTAPPPPPQVQAPRVAGPAKASPAAMTGTDSNAQGLALLQMLIDKKPSTAIPVTKPSVPTSAPRQLTQQQINELISMSKRVPQKPTQSQVTPNFKAAQPQQAYGKPNAVSVQNTSAPVAGPGQTPPHVAALLEQLHRQQLAQQQQQQSSGGTTPPPECQQQ